MDEPSSPSFYHRPINSNFLLKIVGHVLVLLGHFDYANSVSKEIGSDSRPHTFSCWISFTIGSTGNIEAIARGGGDHASRPSWLVSIIVALPARMRAAASSSGLDSTICPAARAASA